MASGRGATPLPRTKSFHDVAFRQAPAAHPCGGSRLGANDTIYVNNEDENEIETANLATGKAGRAVALPGCTGPTGLGFDAKTGYLLSDSANGKAALADTKTHKLVKLIPIGLGPDAVIMDRARRLAFIPCGKDGVLSAITLGAPKGNTVAMTIKTEIGARPGALDPSSGAIYLLSALRPTGCNGWASGADSGLISYRSYRARLRCVDGALGF